MRPGIGGLPRELDGWRVWASDAGTLYATRNDLYGPGSGTTVAAPDAERLREAIGQAEAEAQEQRRRAAAVRALTGR
jgi:hypothetical protein